MLLKLQENSNEQGKAAWHVESDENTFEAVWIWIRLERSFKPI